MGMWGQQQNDGDVVLTVPAGATTVTVQFDSDTAVVLGRGSSANITFVTLQQANGDAYKVYVASGALTVTTGEL